LLKVHRHVHWRAGRQHHGPVTHFGELRANLPEVWPLKPTACTVSAEDTPGVYNNIRQRYQTLQPVEVREDIRIKTGTGRP
jgi:hypothetical protein